MDTETTVKERSVRFLLTEEQFRKLRAIQRAERRDSISDTIRLLIEERADLITAQTLPSFTISA